MSTHNICFYGEIMKIIPKLSSIPSLSVLLLMPVCQNAASSLLFARTLFSLIITHLIPCEFNIFRKHLYV